MMPVLMGKKLGMSQVFGEKGLVEPVTAIEAGPCVVTQVKKKEKEGYDAVQLGFGTAKRLSKAEKGHLKELGAFRYLREFRTAVEAAQVGDRLDVTSFQAGDRVDVTGVSKGKGYAGVVKRHHFRGGPKTHGQSDRERAPGSIGATTTPGRVLKNMRMSGHMGSERVTVRNLVVVRADLEKNLLLVRGAVPGNRNELLLIRKSKGKTE